MVRATSSQSGQPAFSKATPRIVLLLGGIVACLVVLAFAGFEFLSTARAYVNGEALWSKAQKSAVYHLTLYGMSGDEAEHRLFQEHLAIPLAYGVARQELEKAELDLPRAREAFLQGGTHPADVARMIRGFRHFQWVWFIEDALHIWAEADDAIAELEALAAEVRAEVRAGRAGAELAPLLAEVRALDGRLTELETAFSVSMGEGARWSARVLSALLAATGGLLVLAGGVVTRQAVRHLRASEAAERTAYERYRAVVETATDAIIMIDAAGTVLFANRAAERIFGSPRDRIVGGGLAALIPEQLREPQRQGMRRYVETGARGIPWDGVELSALHADGSVVPVEVSLGELTDGPERRFIGIVRDVRERKQLEDQLRQAQRLEAVGRLTGGIAHDFNNLLTVILAGADLLDEELDGQSAQAREELAELRNAAARASEMVGKLLAFSRTGRLRLRPVDLGALIRRSSAMLRRVLPAAVDLRYAVGEAPLVLADAAALEQALLNLATNARDAMPDGGVLSVALGTRQLDARHEADHGWGKPGAYARITVADTGEGMDRQTAERIFEPFFTTKAPGAGTGLGMAMVLGTLQQHGGHVDVESANGEGTRVHLYLPAADDAARPNEVEPAAAPAEELGARDGETVLVVDDEAPVRRTAQRVLESRGYEVLVGADGAEAHRICRSFGASIDLVLSDVVMPVMNGPALLRRLREDGFRAPVLLMSGYTARDVQAGAALDPDLPLLHKPWSADELLRRVRRALDEAAQASSDSRRRARTE